MMDVLEIFGLVSGTVAGIGALAFTASYAWNQAKGGKGKSLQDANDKLLSTLNELMATQDKKISELQSSLQENQQKTAVLEGRVEELSRKNGELQDIINSALDRYFKEHPQEALKMAGIRMARKGDLAPE